eukprot:TRINITY_DN16198_c0_g1_i4.p1 TRINITY_DN16198_c0_g1~~TRINITY_DN16198_c0_g1_i4.p1  ORF type:complete len:818 (-),score=97.65 TRINITY_DN16198_c0_g1_i4:533-2986(-)
MDMDPETQARAEYQRKFLAYLLLPTNPLGLNYKQDLQDISNEKLAVNSSSRLLVDINDLQGYSQELYHKLVTEPRVVVSGFEEGLRDYLFQDENREKLLANLQDGETKVGFVGEFGARQFTPRSLTSQYLSQLVNIVGIVTQCSLVCPKIVKSVHYCEETKLFTTREYRDGTSNVGLPTGSAYPTQDDKGNVLVTEYGLGKSRDHQVISIQELPEDSPPGQLPRSIEVILEDDLVDSCKPGDRVSICGIYKVISTKATGSFSGLMRSVLIGNTVKKFRKVGNDRISRDDLTNFKKLSMEEDCLDQLAESLAPSIFGHEWVKKAIVLLLVGGTEKDLKNGIRLRGDINCLMVGDPGVAKSQLLRAVMHVMPETVSTTGRGASGVGLTAAVVTDSSTGERRLEAGAMVLADRGIVCVDEFDKMNDMDRVAIHEVMEQQTVTISKAGIHTSLNARCSVLAAANPLFGSFDDSKLLTRNINLPDSLLSRFDMLFVMRDEMDEERDGTIARHVVASHRFRQNRVIDHEQNTVDGDQQIPMYHDRTIFNENRNRNRNGNYQKPPLTTQFLKSFLRYVKVAYKPMLSDTAIAEISSYYVDLRDQQSKDQSLPVTTRTLESIIRLSTASAKIRMSSRVEAQDVNVATHIMDIVMNKNTTENMMQTQEQAPLQQINSNISQQQNQDDNEGVKGGRRTSSGNRRTPYNTRRRQSIGMKRHRGVDGSPDENQNKSQRAGGNSSGGSYVVESLSDPESVNRLRRVLAEFRSKNKFQSLFTLAETQNYLQSQGINISSDDLSVFLTMASNTEVQNLPIFYNEEDNTWTPL